MGGASYDRSVYSSDSSSSTGSSWGRSGFSYSRAAAEQLNESVLNESLFPKGRTLTCTAETGIVIVLDHSGSMGDAAKTIFDKMPMLHGQIEKKGYLKDFAISFAGVGDVNSDLAPLQMCDFAKGLKLDEWLKKIYLEGGGGPGTSESYELMALYYLRHAEFVHPKSKKPFMFIIGDESFYPQVSGSDMRKHFGDKTSPTQELASRKIFEDLREKYHVFMLHVPYSCRLDPKDPKGEVVTTPEPALDREISKQWKEIFRQDFIVVREPKAIVDVILGCIALAGETRNLDEYLDDMKGRGQSKARIARVEESLRDVSNALAVRPVSALGAANEGLSRGGKSMRL